MPSFASLGLAPCLLQAIEEATHESPTSIQQAAIPEILSGKDLIASAETGSGKTAAFALPILQFFVARKTSVWRTTHALILVPTRELAVQVGETFTRYAAHIPVPVKVTTVFGGVSINPQMMELRGNADVVVATPGRLLDLARKNAVRLGSVKTLVLDEADRLLALGFADELNEVLTLLPPQRQTLLFSATFPPEVQTLAQALLHSPAKVNVEVEPAAPAVISQRSIALDADKRTQLLRHLIQDNGWPRVLVFVATKYSTEHIAQKLRRLGINAAALHGELSQGARTQALKNFKESKLQVLVATDLAARGIDIAQLPAVVNYDLPRSPTDYIHRIGRTGRAGSGGVAISFVSADTEAHFRLIEKRQKMRLEREHIPGFEPKTPAVASRPSEPRKAKPEDNGSE
jgi:ATP-dependent RNA helicase RhlE